jgi:hypothetical protein
MYHITYNEIFEDGNEIFNSFSPCRDGNGGQWDHSHLGWTREDLTEEIIHDAIMQLGTFSKDAVIEIKFVAQNSQQKSHSKLNKMKKTMFVAFSHTLTEAQIEDAKKSLYVTEIVYLKDVRPELQAKFSNVNSKSSKQEIKDLAQTIVEYAIASNAKVFFCTGEPSVTMWANLYAGGYVNTSHAIASYRNKNEDLFEGQTMQCVQSTTERNSVEKTEPDGTVTKTQIFRHVQWRNLF